MARWMRKTRVRLKENCRRRRSAFEQSQSLFESRTFWILCRLCQTKASATVLVICLVGLLPSWGAECSLWGLRCSRRTWWRTWPRPPRWGWRPGRPGTCPAPFLTDRRENGVSVSVLVFYPHFCSLVLSSYWQDYIPDLWDSSRLIQVNLSVLH